MPSSKLLSISNLFKTLLTVVLLVVSTTVVADFPVEAKTKKKSSRSSSKKKRTTKRSSKRRRSTRSRRSRRTRSSKKRRYSKRRKSSRRRSSRRRRSRRSWRRRKPRYAYPYDFFMLKAPAFNRTPLTADESGQVMRQFVNGVAGHHPASTLVRAGVFKYHALKGGIFFRREPVKYIIMHSTETGNPNMDAVRVINSWSSRGRRHPGAQFVINRDGTIYQAVDPDLGTVHVNIFKTIAGVNNDNCIGIEMVHSGRQNYPPALVTSAVRLVNYLQERYNIPDENVTTHRYVQQGDHTDPVRFNWVGFILQKNKLRNQALTMKMNEIRQSARDWSLEPTPLPGEKKVQGSIITDDTEDSAKPDPNLLDLQKEDVPVESEIKRKHPEVFKEIEEPKPPTTLLQLRGPIELNPEDAEKLNPDD